MVGDEKDEMRMEKLHELITNVRLDIRELNTKMDDIKDLTKKVDGVQDVANEALTSVKTTQKQVDSMEDNQTWLWRTLIGAAVIEIISFFFKYK